MKSYAMSKLSASLVVLVMALSAVMVVIPSENAGSSTTGVNIYVPVTSGGNPVTNAVVNLTDVHTGAVIAATYMASRTSYVATSPAPGYYRIDVSAPSYFDMPGAASVVFTGLKDVTSNQVSLEGFSNKNVTYTVTVSTIGGSGPNGAFVGFYNTSHRQFVAVAGANANGTAVLTMYRTTSSTDVSLVVMKSGYEMHTEPVLVNAAIMTKSVTLTASVKVTASVQDHNGIPAENVVAYLINKDPSVLWVKRVMRTTGSLFAFDAYAGAFTLVVDSPGNNANVSSLTVASTPIPLNIALTKQSQRVEQIDMDFAGDYSHFSLAVATTWNYDDAYPGLMYNDMGSLRAQIDLVKGDGNGVLNSSEISSFSSTLVEYGTQYVTSAGLLVVNQTVFTNDTADHVTLGLAAGAVTSLGGATYSYDCLYTANGTIAASGSRYIMNATARLNSPAADYSYKVTMLTGYVLVDNVTPASGVVMGYRNVTYDSNVTGTGSELIQLTIEKGRNPIASAKIDVPRQNASSVVNKTNVLLRYIVRTGGNVTFNTTGSSDPNGNPLTYIWNFTDGTVVTTMNPTVVHKFTSSFNLTKVNLTVQNPALLKGYAEINVTSDGLSPTPVLSAKAGKVVAKNNEISVNQSQLITFNATYSRDDAVIVGDHQGDIARFNFSWGEKNNSGSIDWANTDKNKTYSYAKAGTYIVVLAMTDVVGHSSTVNLTVKVNDTSAPSVKFRYWNSTGQSGVVENATVRFDANATRDNEDNYTLMHYSWSFGDKTWTNGTGLYNVTHSFAKIGSFNVTLKVTDLSNNNGSSTVKVSVAHGLRPNLIISKVYFDPKNNFTQGSTGYILVNITNTGNAVATNVLVQFYLVPEDGSPLVKIGDSSSMLNGTTVVTTILPGGKVQVKFAYSPSHTGTLTIKVNVTAKDQLTPYSYTASGTQALHVKEAAYKAILLWIGVAAVIVAVPTLLYVRSRWMKREKKGPRRERKESKEKESKESKDKGSSDDEEL